MKRVLINLWLILILISPTSPTWAADVLQGRVVGIPSGDEILFYRDNRVAKYRLAFIDAPEFDQKEGRKAQEFLSSHCFMKEVDITIVRELGQGITIVVLNVDTLNINQQMVRYGWAWAALDKSKPDYYAILETEARKKGWGIWKSEQPLAPWEYRKQVAVFKQNQKDPTKRPTFTQYADQVIDVQKQVNRFNNNPYGQDTSGWTQGQPKNQDAVESPSEMTDIVTSDDSDEE